MEPEPDKISRNLMIYVLTYAPQTKTVDTTISKHKTNRSRSSLLCNVEPSLTFNSFSEIQFDCGTNQLAESLNPRNLYIKGRGQNCTTWNSNLERPLLTLHEDMDPAHVCYDDDNRPIFQSRTSLFLPNTPSQWGKRLKVELSHTLLEVLHTLFLFNLFMKVRLLIVAYCKEFAMIESNLT